MSFDIYLQAFRNGDKATGDGSAGMAILEPLIVERDDDHGWALIRTDDGTADVFGLSTPDDGFLFNHVSGRTAWDVIHAVASAAGFVVMPIGCGTLLVDQSMRVELPDGIPEPIELIGSGEDLLLAIETAD